MNFGALLNVGKLAAAAKAALKLSAAIGGRIVTVLLKIVELEQRLSLPGEGPVKLRDLLTWAEAQFGEQAIDLVKEFAGAIVALLNVIKVFRK